ncbi:E3 ubiquitin-protein ligase rififylin [Aethina tumida]|uniref:E3 ubiquitin-protein ligase rififylin n=1 Tax=Aethina tumida TaxID=116153 RepID=UPI00096AE180|nr:E3 ubiquitin-protein ligase rififylin [Aethina tumida]
MPCTRCRSDFNLLNWKIKCGECDDKYCNKCLKKWDGILYCDKCMILLKRPPDRVKLMELKPKDLQAYLNKNNISTYGIVEKQELVDLLCNKHIPQKPKKGFVEKVTANIGGTAQINQFIDSLIPQSPEQRNSRPKGATSSSPPPRPPDLSPTHQQPRTSFPPHHSAPPQPSAPPSEEASQFNVRLEHTSETVNVETAVDAATTIEPQPTTSTAPAQSEEIKKEETPSGSPLPPKYPKLSDFQEVDELSSLSAKQLKQLLTLNRVDFKGCVEKNELLERAVRLWIDNNELHRELPENIQDLCKLCMDGPLDCVLLECGHIATCIECGKKLAECPICRQYVIRVVRTFKA